MKVVDTTHVGHIVYPKRYVSHRDVIVIYRYIPSLNCPMLFHIAHRGGICFLIFRSFVFFVRSFFNILSVIDDDDDDDVFYYREDKTRY